MVTGASTSDLAIILVDARYGVQIQTKRHSFICDSLGIKQFVVAINKMDKDSADPDRVKNELSAHDVIPEDWGGDVPFIPVSAKTGDGIGLLKDHLKDCMGYQQKNEGQFIARRRHLDAIDTAEEHLAIAHINLHQLQAGELLAEELLLAQQYLSEITGEFSSDDLLGKIFSDFCIGK